MSRSQQWTFAIGLRRAFVHVVVWGFVCWAGVAALLWVNAPWMNWMVSQAAAGSRRRNWLLGLAAAVIAIPVIWLLWSRLKDAAGFTGWLLGWLGWLSICAVAIGGAVTACGPGPLDPKAGVFAVATIAVVAALYLLYDVWTD